MPTLRKPKPIENEIYIATTGFSTGAHTVRRGERRRGSDPAVKESFGLFVLDGVPENEWPSVWDHLVENPVEHESELYRPPPPIADADACVADMAFSVGLRNVPKDQRFDVTIHWSSSTHTCSAPSACS